MIFVDTSFLLALVNPRDELYGRAVAWVEALWEPWVVTEYVLVELVNAYSKPQNRPKAHKVMEIVQSGPDCEVVFSSAELLAKGIFLHAQRPDKEWSLTDCLSFLVMQERGLSRALTHDHHFEQAGFEALLCRDPP